jgi:transcription elongation GreA/GreB family factor
MAGSPPEHPAVMSRAFVKEAEGTEVEALPELVVSPHRNLVTPEGLARIESTLAQLEAALSGARAREDRHAAARAERDLRYWRQRRVSAEVVVPEPAPATVRFGSWVVLSTDDGARLRFRIVGEDEADPKHGLISYVAPLAVELLGASVGEEIKFRNGTAAIEAIE